MSDDPERLVAEALRAHAARTPLPPPATDPAGGVSQVLGGYRPLSGSGVTMPPHQPGPTAREPADAPADAEQTNRFGSARGGATGWILLLAALLGLATGAVVGLVTLL